MKNNKLEKLLAERASLDEAIVAEIKKSRGDVLDYEIKSEMLKSSSDHFNENKIINVEFFIKWTWLIIITFIIFVKVMIFGEHFAYAIGDSSADLAVGFFVSPVIFILLKKLLNIKWAWYHWLNITAYTGFGLFMLKRLTILY
jgi:hypothetical protein